MYNNIVKLYMGTISKGPVFLFVLTLIANFLFYLFSCDLRRLFNYNIHIKWIVGYFVLFFVVFLGNYQGNKTMKYLAFISIFYYIWIIALMKVHPYIFFLVMTILSIGFMTDLYVEHHSNNPENHHLKRYEKIHEISNYLALFITLVAFIYYYIHSDKSNINDILFNTKCEKM